jgi:hypothetical protein
MPDELVVILTFGITILRICFILLSFFNILRFKPGHYRLSLDKDNFGKKCGYKG